MERWTIWAAADGRKAKRVAFSPVELFFEHETFVESMDRSSEA